jgi:hypothetical protein
LGNVFFVVLFVVNSVFVVELSWKPHLEMILSESLPNGASGEKSMPQPGAPLEYHLVRNVSESLSNGASGEKSMHQPDEPETTIWWGFWKNHYLEKQIYPTTEI